MNDAGTTVLLVEDDPADARLIQAALAGAGQGRFQVASVERLVDALAQLRSNRFEVVLLDLSLPDGPGLDGFEQVSRAAPDTLILVLNGPDDEEIARQAVARGACDAFTKHPDDAHWLTRSLHHVVERKAARTALQRSEARFRAISDASPLGIFVSDASGRCVYTNAAYQAISGLSLEQTLGTNWGMAVHPDDRARVLAEWHDAAQNRTALQTEFRFLQDDARIVWTRVNSAAMLDGTQSLGLVQTVEDITDRKAAEEILFEEKERAQVTLNSIGDAVLTSDLAGKVVYMNRAAESMTGWTNEEAAGQPISTVFPILDATTREAAANPMLHAIKEDRTVGLATDSVLIHRNGTERAIEDSAAPIHNRSGHVIGAVIVFRDVSESRAMALQMAHLAQHDFLTSLPNRMLLTERFGHAIRLARRHRKQIGLLFLDLDHFKQINDTLGHAVGDRLLQSVANRLVECVRATDTVCRQGGDEFVILLAEIEQPQDAAHVALTLRDALARPHRIGEHVLHVSPSIGISIFPDDGTDVDSLMQRADTAMYHAKANGRDTYQFFRAGMRAPAARPLDKPG